MLFNSIDFAVFLPVVFLLYWFVTNKNLKIQNALLLVASYVFYGWWDWRFLSLIVFSSIVDYWVGISIEKTENTAKRKALLTTSILVNIGFLGFFKYFNFFSESFADAFTLLGNSFEPARLNIILPVGISFYTFQTLSYSIDVYKRKLKPTHDPVAFFAFVSFFPQLVAGPIERATNLLPQFYRKRTFEYDKAVDGLKQMLWGFFKKIVIADNCAMFANDFFSNYTEYSGSTLLLGALFFTFQIYGDFSGYSDIAIGTSRLFGFNIMRNFAYPYFSRDIAEFWRRWHISLSTWFRDYVYIPLGGSRGGTWMKVRNTFIIFVVSGFWHGANWTFIAWGALNAIYFLPLLLLKRNRANIEVVAHDKFFPSFREFVGMAITFSLTVLAWIFFRAESMGHAFSYIAGIFNESLFYEPQFQFRTGALKTIVLILFLLSIEWAGRRDEHPLARLGFAWKRPFRWAMYYGIVILILSFAGRQQQFIYFQF
ncbi:MAG: MBOAT family protein [Bacteroidales bacterium]|nr:MBOAT family protein [Bacteroidales bacterium]